MSGPNSCDPCECIPPKMSVDYWRQAIVTLLCGTSTVIVPEVSKAFGAVPAAFAAIGLTNPAKRWKFFRVINDLNTDVAISFDGGLTTAFTVKAGTTFDLSFGANGSLLRLAALVTDIYYKYVTAPGSGTVRFEGFY